MPRSLHAPLVSLALATTLAPGLARASGSVYWSIGVSPAPGVAVTAGNIRPPAPAYVLPPVVAPATVYSSTHAYPSAYVIAQGSTYTSVYIHPAPVYRPPAVIYSPPPVVHTQPLVTVAPVYVVPAPAWPGGYGGHGHGHRHHHGNGPGRFRH